MVHVFILKVTICFPAAIDPLKNMKCPFDGKVCIKEENGWLRSVEGYIKKNGEVQGRAFISGNFKVGDVVRDLVSLV